MSIQGLGSVELAYMEWQRRSIPHVVRIAWDGGADLKRGHYDNWEYRGHRKGMKYWNNKGQRDMICFAPEPPIQEYKRIPGRMRVTDTEPDMALVDSIVNETERDQPEQGIDYERGQTISRREVDQGTLGISIMAYVEAQAGGGETTGGSYAKVGSSTTLSAEYMHALEKGQDTSKVVTRTRRVIPKARSISIIEQSVQLGQAELKIKEKLVIDPRWWVVDFRRLNGSSGRSMWLKNNRDWSHWNGHSRILWKCESIAELEAQLTGKHPEYPEARKGKPLDNKWVRKAYEWLMDEDNRTIESETTIKFDTADNGDAVIRYEPLDEAA